MNKEKALYQVNRETGELVPKLSPSKILAWVVAILVIAYAGIWLWQMAVVDQKPISGELVLGGVVAGGAALSYALYHRPGDFLDYALRWFSRDEG